MRTNQSLTRGRISLHTLGTDQSHAGDLKVFMEAALKRTKISRQVEPSTADLAAIDREWPLIEAEIALVDAEIRVLTNDGGPSELDWRRLRRAEERVMRELLARLAVRTATRRAA